MLSNWEQRSKSWESAAELHEDNISLAFESMEILRMECEREFMMMRLLYEKVGLVGELLIDGKNLVLWAHQRGWPNNNHTLCESQLQWISLEAKVVKKHTWSRLRKNATCWESVRKYASVLNFCIDTPRIYIVNVVKVRSPIISPLECAHIFEEQQLSRRSSLRHQRGKECHICLAGAYL